MIYKWFDHLKKQGYGTVAYVIMPNHVHTIHYFPGAGFNLNKIMGTSTLSVVALQIWRRREIIEINPSLISCFQKK